MDDMKNRKQNRELDSDILYSKTVKAGKRIYYIDVKCDRKGEYYLSITESKRMKGQQDSDHFVFEKHKIFLYREDLKKFQEAFNAAIDFTTARAQSDTDVWDDEDTRSLEDDKNFKFDIEF